MNFAKMSCAQPDLILLGVCGSINAGKDTLADCLVANHGFKRIAFAAALKDIVARLFGWDRRMLEGCDAKLRAQREVKDAYWSQVFGRDITPRHILQIMGTEVIRNSLHKDMWVKIVEREIKQGVHGARVVITDARFPNEIAMIRALGGKVVRVKRGVTPDWETKLVAGVPKDQIPNLPHASEHAWIGHEDHVLDNNSTKQALEQAVVSYIKLDAAPTIIHVNLVNNNNKNLTSRVGFASDMTIAEVQETIRQCYGAVSTLTNTKGIALDKSGCQVVCDLKGFLGKDMCLYYKF